MAPQRVIVETRQEFFLRAWGTLIGLIALIFFGPILGPFTYIIFIAPWKKKFYNELNIPIKKALILKYISFGIIIIYFFLFSDKVADLLRREPWGYVWLTILSNIAFIIFAKKIAGDEIKRINSLRSILSEEIEATAKRIAPVLEQAAAIHGRNSEKYKEIFYGEVNDAIEKLKEKYKTVSLPDKVYEAAKQNILAELSEMHLDYK